jgi:hypothetical protein
MTLFTTTAIVRPKGSKAILKFQDGGKHMTKKRSSTFGAAKALLFGIATFGLLTGGSLYFVSLAEGETTVGARDIPVSQSDLGGFRCSDNTLRGRYAVRGEGWVPNGPPGSPFVPFANVSLMTLDGEGNLENDITVSRNGQITRNVDQGTYSVGHDCKGTMTVNIPTPPFTLTFDLVIFDAGKAFYFIATTPSVVNHQAIRLE